MSFQKRSRKKKLALTLGLVPFLVGGVVSPVTAAEITETITDLKSLPSNGLKYLNDFLVVYAEDGKLTIRLASDTTPVFTGLYINSLAGGFYSGSSDITNIKDCCLSFEQGNFSSADYNDIYFYNYIYGGYSYKGSANNNTVNISGGTISASKDNCIYGGDADNGSANNNTVNISGGTISASEDNNIFGGYSKYAATGNIVNITGGSITAKNNNSIFGGDAVNGSANNNTVNISGGTISASENNKIFGGYSNFGSAIGNVVNITGGSITASENNYIYGGYSDYYGSAIGNVVNITGGSISAKNNHICGGYSTDGSASDNIVNIALSNNLTLSGNTSIYGGVGSDGDATNNKVYLFNPDGNENDFEKITRVYGGSATAGYAKNNSVIIGKDINGVVYNNPINMGSAEIHGGHSDAGNNTLEIYSTGNTVNSISDFQALKFYVPATAVNGNTMLTVTDAATDLSGVTIKAGVATGSQLKKDNVINLLANTNGFTGDPSTMKADLTGTGLVQINGTVTKTDTGIILTMNEDINKSDPDPKPDPKPKKLAEESKSLAETRAGGMAFLNSAADMAVGKGFMSAQAAAEADGNNGTSTGGFTPYAAVGAANMTYETGSYVDSKGWGINVGLSRIINYENSKLTLAPFVEYGKASYDSYLENATNTHGSGDNSFTGIGFMAKKEQNDGIYYEGSVRLGRAKADYNGGEMLGEYDTASNYLAFHAGIGRVQELSKKSNINYYGKLFYTHQEGDDVTVNRPHIGDSFVYNFDAINSCRLRLGTRFTQKLNNTDSFYAGLAWDYEFDSEARAHYNGMSTPAPSMKGSSGMLELGWKQEATKENPIGVDVGLTGWCGKQRGVSFNAGFSWAF